MRICAVIITFNPSIDALRLNISELQKQAADVIIVDNASDNSCQLDELDGVRIIKNDKNIGLGAAQNKGMDAAFQSGYDFIVQFDQDSTPRPNCVNFLTSVYEKLTLQGYKVGIVGCSQFDVYSRKLKVRKFSKSSGGDFDIVTEVLSSGSLIGRDVYHSVGKLNESLFIDLVDFEYCWRVADHGYSIVCSKNAVIEHALGEGKKKILGIFSIGVPSAFRNYFQYRNHLILAKMQHVPSIWFYKNSVKLAVKFFIYLIFFPDRFLRFKYIRKGLYDGYKGKQGNLLDG